LISARPQQVPTSRTGNTDWESDPLSTGVSVHSARFVVLGNDARGLSPSIDLRNVYAAVVTVPFGRATGLDGIPSAGRAPHSGRSNTDPGSREVGVAPSGFEPLSPAPKASMLGHYTTGLSRTPRRRY
jgi:hypothetical protein